jgi:hypothetical protein
MRVVTVCTDQRPHHPGSHRGHNGMRPGQLLGQLVRGRERGQRLRVPAAGHLQHGPDVAQAHPGGGLHFGAQDALGAASSSSDDFRPDQPI